MKKQTKIMCVVAAIAVLIAVMAGSYLHFGPKAQEGAKKVTLEVVDDQDESEKYEVHTDAEYLIGLMKDAEKEGFTFEGEKGEFGTTVVTVNGLTADFEKGSTYWAFYVNGEYANYGPDEQPIADGDQIKIEYSEWKE